MTGYCGINCKTCPCYQASLHDNILEKMNLAIQWSKLFKRTFLPREMSCKGCKQDEVIFTNCKACTIRQQARDQAKNQAKDQAC